MSRKKLLLIIGGAVVVAAIIIANITMNTSKAIEVQATLVKARTVVEKVSASGRIQPQTKVDITSEINGEIIDLLVKEGDHVEVGTLLAVLDTVQVRTDVDQARYAVTEIGARLDGARTALDQAEEEFKRQERLFNSDLTSETIYKNAKYAHLNAKAAFKATQAQARQFESRYAKQLDYLSKAKIVAPMAGVITFLDCEIGEIAPAQSVFSQGRTLMTIADLSVYEVEVEVDETSIAKVELGQGVEIEVDAILDTVFQGEVVEIGNTAILSGLGTQDQSTNFRVRIIFDEPHRDIRPGMSADVDITTAEREHVLSIPYSAVVMRSFDPDSLERAARSVADESEDSEEPDPSELHAAEADGNGADETDEDIERKEYKGVFVIRDGKVQFAEITTGIADQKNIEVTSGLDESDSIVAGPYSVLRTIRAEDEVKAIKKDKGDRRRGRDN
ncbi:MAG: efflux RND transporter periplasmic adaptor subunit [candidate division Zixibacteria bacterium]|nr:efflux RND transporter periplasmic adaptor subunit [candidate division Zixibacteria bacterium]